MNTAPCGVPSSRRTWIATSPRRDAHGDDVARLRGPACRRSRRFIEAVAIGSSASSTRGAARHAAGVPVLELAAGDQHEGVLGIGPLVGRDDVGRHQLHAAVAGREVVDEHDGLARVVLAEAGVGHARLALQRAPR